MNTYKRVVRSVLLNRAAHADVFEVGGAARFLFVLFGGSGVDEEEYELRGRTVIPVFDRVLAAPPTSDFTFVHVTAPFDVPFGRFGADPSAAETWNAHVTGELLAPWGALPYYVCGFSGGAALALNGLHANPRCFGGAAFGADALPPDFARPAHWAAKLRLYAAPNDPVCNHPTNRRAVEDEPLVEVFARQPDGAWLLTTATGLAVEFVLITVPARVPLADVYDGVTFPERPLRENTQRANGGEP